MKRITIWLCFLFCCSKGFSQDPDFSQFFASPLTVNPALTGNFYGQWMGISNFRNQWAGPVSPYKTVSLCFQSKAMKKVTGENNTLGFGGMIINDESMDGAFKSIYSSFTSAYHVTLDADNQQHIGIGLGGIYANRRIDFAKLSFPAQFSNGSFDLSLPNGETSLSAMKPFWSATAGFVYSYTGDFNFDIGVAGFHFNKPSQTVLQDGNQFVYPRYVLHSNFETYLNEQVVLAANVIYQKQKSTASLLIGGTLGYNLSTDDDAPMMFNAGAWYRNKDAIIPYLGLTVNNFQFGLTYDVTISKLKDAAIKPRTFELSLIVREPKAPKGIPCTWK